MLNLQMAHAAFPGNPSAILPGRRPSHHGLTKGGRALLHHGVHGHLLSEDRWTRCAQPPRPPQRRRKTTCDHNIHGQYLVHPWSICATQPRYVPLNQEVMSNAPIPNSLLTDVCGRFSERRGASAVKSVCAVRRVRAAGAHVARAPARHP